MCLINLTKYLTQLRLNLQSYLPAEQIQLKQTDLSDIFAPKINQLIINGN